MAFSIPRSSRGANERSAFTIIELLTVIGMLSILAAIAVPVWSGSRLNAKQACRGLIRAHLQQTRAHAIASRNATAMVIPTRNSPRKLNLNAMSAIEVQLQDGNYVPSQSPKLLKPWTHLPEKFHFETSNSEHPTVIDFENTLMIPFQHHDVECHIIVFSPNGQIVYPPSGSSIRIAIGQGPEDSGEDLLMINRLTAKARKIRP
jgi:prepilin-type N-terminal cleavage/methylation domain-containing protein